MVIIGLERLVRDPELLSETGRLGLLYNQGSVDSGFRSTVDLLHGAFPGRLTALFGPQHGVGLTEQDNMIETANATHPVLGIPVYSLYSGARKPSPEMLENVDAILVDLQDVGARVYTFATTVLHMMEMAAQEGKTVVILDRPNPINGRTVEGNLLNPAFASFVGPYPIPMRHGLTLGELMRLYNEEYEVGCWLQVVTMSGWDRNDFFDRTGLTWVMPSPNMPLVETAVVYPGQVLLEGTNVSEGRGTTRPFEIFGTPYLDPSAVLAKVEDGALEGAVFQEIAFKPTFNKWSSDVCRGFHIQVTDRDAYRPYRCSLALLSAILQLYPERFKWADPPYEYVHDKLPIDVILGDAQVRSDLEQGRSVQDMEREWQEQLKGFVKLRSKFLLY